MPSGLPDPQLVSFLDFIKDPATLNNASPEEISAARDFLNKKYPAGSTRTTTSPTTTTLPRERKVGPIRDKKLEDELKSIQSELDSLRKTPSAPAGAFVSDGMSEGGTPDEQPMPPALPPAKTTAQSLIEAAAPSAASMAGATAAASMAPGALKIPAAIVGAGIGGAGGSLTIEGAKRAMGAPDAPDSIDDALSTAFSRGSQEAMGEIWGQGIGAVTSRLNPYRRAVTPESEQLMKDLGSRIRSAYESIGGAPLVEDTRAVWNPFRYIRPMATELSDNAVVRRLEARGLDPQAAREVALSGGLLPDRVDNSLFSRLQRTVMGSKASPEMRLAARNRAKATLVQTGILEDMGLKYAETMPAEDWGKALNAAINGRFNVLTAARQAGMNAISEDLPADFLIDVSRLKSRTHAGPGSELVQALPDKARFQDIAQVRSNIVAMATDLHLSPEARYDAAMIAKDLDKRTQMGLPKNLQSEFGLWAQADNDMNFEQFNTAFMKGMLKQPKVARKYAEQIINLGDSDSYKSLERALANTDDGERIFANVKNAIGERFIEKAKKGDIIDPTRLRLSIDTESRGYGRAFLNRTLGPDFVKHAEDYATVAEQVNEAMRKAGVVISTLTTFGAGANSIRNLYHGNVSSADLVPITAALFSPKVASMVFSSRLGTKLLTKAAENVAAGRNPKTTARLAGRALSAIGLNPEELLSGSGLVPEERLQEEQMQTRSMRGEPFAALGGAT